MQRPKQRPKTDTLASFHPLPEHASLAPMPLSTLPSPQLPSAMAPVRLLGGATHGLKVFQHQAPAHVFIIGLRVHSLNSINFGVNVCMSPRATS